MIEIDSYAEMLQMWKESKPGCWSTVSENPDQTCEEAGDADVMEQVWRTAMPCFSSTESKEPMLGPVTTETIDAEIATRLEGVRARMYDKRATDNPMAWRMRIAWRDPMIGTVMRSDMLK